MKRHQRYSNVGNIYIITCVHNNGEAYDNNNNNTILCLNNVYACRMHEHGNSGCKQNHI